MYARNVFRTLITLWVLTFLGCAEPGETTTLQDEISTAKNKVYYTPLVEYRGTKLPVVDMHLHTGSWDEIPPAMQNIIGNSLPFPFSLSPKIAVNSILSAEGISLQLIDSKINHGVLLAVYAPHTTGLTTNEFVRRQIRKMPMVFHGMASLSMENWPQDSLAALDNMAKHLKLPEFIGIKMVHAHVNVNFNDPLYYPIYAVADQLGVPVYFHSGSAYSPGSATNPEATDPAYLEEAIQLFPNVKFILGHMGYDFAHQQLGTLDSCLRLAREYPNVYLETSQLGSARSDPTGQNLPIVLKAIKENGFLDRVIYGSDGPQAPGIVKDHLVRTLIALDKADYSVEEARAFLFDNFINLYGLEAVQVF